jgi:hypothetical protein
MWVRRSVIRKGFEAHVHYHPLLSIFSAKGGSLIGGFSGPNQKATDDSTVAWREVHALEFLHFAGDPARFPEAVGIVVATLPGRPQAGRVGAGASCDRTKEAPAASRQGRNSNSPRLQPWVTGPIATSPGKGDTTMPHSLTALLIHVFFSTKDQRPILDDDLRSNVQKDEIEYDETYLWPRLCTALSRARLCLDHSPRLKPWAIVVATLTGRPRNVETPGRGRKSTLHPRTDLTLPFTSEM